MQQHVFPALPMHQVRMCPKLKYLLTPIWGMMLDDAITIEKMHRVGTMFILLDSGFDAFLLPYSVQRDQRRLELLRLPGSYWPAWPQFLMHYFQIARQLTDSVLGYFEPAVGESRHRVAVRETLEAEGLHPLPVFLPTIDTWEYFFSLRGRYHLIGIDCTPPVECFDRDLWFLEFLMALWSGGILQDTWLHLYNLPSSFATAALPPPIFSVDTRGWPEYSDPILAVYQSSLCQRAWRWYQGDIESLMPKETV